MPRLIRSRTLCVLLLLFCLIGVRAVFAQNDDDFLFGLVLIGRADDRGWSQAHAEGVGYVEFFLPGTRGLIFEALNETDNPNVSLEAAVTPMIEQGAQLIITSSTDFERQTILLAEQFPDVVFINIGGSAALTGGTPANFGNLMGQMEWGKLIAGCAAGLTTETGSIGYLGALDNSETRRLASSAYLGARYCYERYQGGAADDLAFTLTWIGFWFNIPGVTLDPVETTSAFYDSGADVVISGIDTPEAIEVAGTRQAQGEAVFAIPYDYAGSCAIAPDACLGVPYYKWGPSYARIVQTVRAGEWQPVWEWLVPDWDAIDSPDATGVGYLIGQGLNEEQTEQLGAFIADLAAYADSPLTPTNEFGITSIALWRGPLALSDGSELAGPGQLVDPLDIWYLPQLLDGIVSESS